MTVRAQAGFTLVEVLVTLAIIALVSAMIIITAPTGKPPVVALSDTLVSALNRAAQTSIITGEPQAFGASKTAHALYRFSDGRWIAQTQESWPKAITAVLEREKRVLALSDEVVPLIVFEPTGLSTPFTLSLSSEGTIMQLGSTGNGQVRLQG